jgi:uncharacterized protein YjeT (DUF2065 family)
MDDLWVALGLLLALEGLLMAAFPDAMKRYMATVIGTPGDVLRAGGLVAAVIGLAVVWLIRG